MGAVYIPEGMTRVGNLIGSRPDLLVRVVREVESSSHDLLARSSKHYTVLSLNDAISRTHDSYLWTLAVPLTGGKRDHRLTILGVKLA